MPFKPFVLTGFLFGAVAIGQAQSSVALTFANEAKREIWTQSGAAGKPASDSLRSEKSFVSVPLTAEKKDTDNLYIWDQSTGNLASKSVGTVRKDGTWDVKAEDFKLVGMVTARIEHAGQPLAAGEVTLSDGARTQSELLDPTTKGEVHFYGVKPGSLKITARYKTKEGASKSITQLLDAPLKRSDANPTATISVPEDVATVGADAAAATPVGDAAAKPGTGAPASNEGTKAAPEPAAKSDNGNAFGSFIVYLIGIAVAGVLVFVAIRYARQNSDLVQGKLEQLGVDIPKPGDDTMNQQYDPVPAPMPKKPEPPQKIILDGAAPDTIGAPATVSAVPSGGGQIMVSGGEPSLVSDTGDAMALPEGETVVGREVGLGLSLVGESTVSRRHAQLMRSGNEVTLTDLGSTNGTYVNGNPLQGSTPLRSGDTVQFGAVRFRYEA